MKTWAVQDAKARFSELLESCKTNGPQLVTKRGVETAVLIPVETWKILQSNSKPSLKSLLLTDTGRGDIPVPNRGQARRRAIDVEL